MASWTEQLKVKRRQALARREIELAIDEVIGNRSDKVWREWYRALVLRRRTDDADAPRGR